MSTEDVGRLAVETPFSSADEIIAEVEEAEERSIRAEVWKIAWPSVLTFALMTTNGILDRMFVGRLGRDALAAVGVGGQVIFLLVALSMAISVGTTALVARFTGAQEPDEAARATGQSITLGLLVAIVSTLAVYAGLDPLLHAMGLDLGAQAECRQFLHMALLGMVPMFLVTVISSAFRGLGDTKTPLKVMVCANLCHVFGDLTLMLGYFGAPALGLKGGGIALALANTVSFVVYWLILRWSVLRNATARGNLTLTVEWARRILKIGIPAAFTAMLRTTSLMGFTFVLARTAEGTSAVASLPIGLTAESIAFMPGFGFSVAASALVGQALGARRPELAERYGWAATWQAATIMTTMGVVFFLFAEPFARVFSHDPTVLPLAVRYLKIMAFSEPMLAFGMVLTGALQGAGETVKPAILTALSFWGFRIPAAWLLALRLGYNTNGAWLAMSATTALGGVLSILLFRDDSWKRIKV